MGMENSIRLVSEKLHGWRSSDILRGNGVFITTLFIEFIDHRTRIAHQYVFRVSFEIQD
jgi:hypothetical protein